MPGHTPFGIRARGSFGVPPANPNNFSPFISLNVISGLAGLVDLTHISLWPDESGNGNNAVQGTDIQRPWVVRSGPFTSANGGPVAHFFGLTPGQTSNMGGALLPNNPSVANGYDLLFYGRFWFPDVLNGDNSSIIFQDGTGGRPQIGFATNAAPHRWFERDDLGTQTGDPFLFTEYGLMRWKFVPASATTGTVTATLNGTTRLSGPYQFNPALTSSWEIGAGGGGTAAPSKMDLCAFCWFTQVLTNRQVDSIEQFWVGQYG